MRQLTSCFPTRTRAVQAATVALAAIVLLAALIRNDAGAVAPDGEPFARTWARTDKPVADLVVDRTWIWGPEANTPGMFEPYVEGHDNGRFVQYFDKARMEITTNPNVPIESAWHVTNGLLVVEMMSGQLQVGNDTFEPRVPASVNVAGDPDDDGGPTYAALGNLRDADPRPAGELITSVVDRFGNVTEDAALSAHGVSADEYVELTDHTVASVFWEFMNADGTVWNGSAFVNDDLFLNPFYATGYPITEAYWTTVEVADTPMTVLLQCFERRCLTYTPDNSDGWQVEAGNVGQHYYRWRYETVHTPEPTATPTVTAEPTTSPTPTTGATDPTPTPTLPSGVTTTGDMQIEHVSPSNGVIIRNMQIAGDIQMEGWQLRDAAGNVFTFPNVIVREGFYISVKDCAGTNIIDPQFAILYFGQCVGFPQGQLQLIDSTGTVVDTYP